MELCTSGTQKMKKKHFGKQIPSKQRNTYLEKILDLIVNNHIDLFKLYKTVFYYKIYTYTVRCMKIKNYFFLKKNYNIYPYVKLTVYLIIRQRFNPMPDG